MKEKLTHFELREKLQRLENNHDGALYNHIVQGMQRGWVSPLELRQAGLVAKNILYDCYDFHITSANLTEGTEYLLRITMASVLPTAQAKAVLMGMYDKVDRESLEHACKHAGKYHEYLYSIVCDRWSLIAQPATWSTPEVRAFRKKALKAYKASPSPATARTVAVSLLPPAEAQILRDTNTPLTEAQLRIATRRAPSPTYERAVAEYAYTLESRM